MADTAFRLVVLYSVFAYTVFALGLLGLCRPAWMLAAALAALSALAVLTWREFRRHRPLRSHAGVLLFALAAALVYAHVFLIPPYVRDDMIYHLLVPKQMAMTGRMAFDPFNVNSNFPFLFEMPLAALASLRLPLSPFLPNFCFALALLLTLHGALVRRSGLAVGPALAVTAAFASTPVIFDLLHSCYVEILFALLVTLAALAYLQHLEHGSPPRGAWLKACACLGLAAAVKYPGVIFAGFFLGWEFFRARDRRAFYAGAAVCAALAAPWYVKNWIWTGNPVFPFANGLFGSPWISPRRFEGFHRMLVDYNMGRSAVDYAALPFRLAFGIDHAGPGYLGFDGKLSLLFLAALAGLGRRDKGQVFASSLFLVYFAVWARESQQSRFLLAVLPVMLVFGLRRWAAWPGAARWITAASALVLAQNGFNIAGKLQSERILALLGGRMDREAFLTAQMPVSHGLARRVNALLSPGSHKLMTVGSFGRNYYFDVPVLTNTYYDQEIFRRGFTRGNAEPDSVAAFLNRNGVTHVLFNWDFVRRMHAPDTAFDMAALEAWFDSTARVEYALDNLKLYERM